MKNFILRAAIASAALLPLWAPAPGFAGPAPDVTVKALLARDLNGRPGKEIRMLTVEYVAAGASLPHRHNAQVFVYVLEGAIRMQIQGQAPVSLSAGDTFYEGPDDVHALSQNASTTRPARILVFMIKDKAAPVSIPVAGAHKP